MLSDLIGHPKFLSRDSDYIRWYPKTLTPYDGAGFPASPRPTGIYIHVPFCDRLCRFCPFNKQRTMPAEVALYVDGLLREIELYASISRCPGLEFIYFGGGSPSVLPPRVLRRIIETIKSAFKLTSQLEVTAECHPTHLNKASAVELREAGITRVSTGIQSFDDACLVRLGAQHSAADAERAIESVADAFGSVAIDLLFRCPNQSVSHWIGQLQRACAISAIDHISLYSLVLKSSKDLPSEEIEASMTVVAHEQLTQCGFHHYASCASGGFDFSKPSRHCTYEERHWGAPQAEFIGMGPGALGYLASTTTVNGLGLANYSNCLRQNRLPLVSCTTAGEDEAMRRYFVLGVKTLYVPFAPFRDRFQVEPTEYFASEFSRLGEAEFAFVTDQSLTLTWIGRLFVDTVSSFFFSEREAAVPHPEEPQIRRVEVAMHRSRNNPMHV